MTRRDFELIAGALKESAPANPDNKLLADFHRSTVENVASALATTNPRFDREHFTRASGA